MDLGDIPMDLLDDIAPLPMHGQPAAASAAASGRSSVTAALTPSGSRGSGDAGGLGPPMGSTTSIPWHPAAAQQAWHAAPRQPPALPSGSSVAPAVLASAHGMLSMPGQAAPLVGYGMQPSADACKLTSMSLKVSLGSCCLAAGELLLLAATPCTVGWACLQRVQAMLPGWLPLCVGLHCTWPDLPSCKLAQPGSPRITPSPSPLDPPPPPLQPGPCPPRRCSTAPPTSCCPPCGQSWRSSCRWAARCWRAASARAAPS